MKVAFKYIGDVMHISMDGGPMKPCTPNWRDPMKYHEWLSSLTDQQLRALAFQAKVHGWRVGDLSKLRKRLLGSDNGKALFKEHYGIQADLQN